MEQVHIYYLLKIGDKQHVENLFALGEVYMKPLNDFRKNENNIERRDEHEGADSIAQVNYLKFDWGDGKEYEFFKDSDKMRLSSSQFRSFNQGLKGNLYCMIGISPKAELVNERLDERNKRFGDTILLITNPIAFLERLSKELKRVGLKHYMGFVTYYNEKLYQGKLSLFNKTDMYKHQNEFRVFVEYEKDEPLTLYLGSLKDISKLYPIEKFSHILFRPA